MTKTSLESMAEPRRDLLSAIKQRGPSPIATLAGDVGITYEATRQQLGQLELEGWVCRSTERVAAGPGRPRSLYSLTREGDHLFPKAYEDLAVTLIDVATDELGSDAVRSLLSAVAERKVQQWKPRVEGRPLRERLAVVKDIYQQDDPFTSIEMLPDGGARLIERNCPYLEVARRRPALCSVTVSVLRQLLGRKVTRVERFQNGSPRCVFHVAPDDEEPETTGFAWEPEVDT